ncbi:tRNA threonylcarbamoyladenosine biosynthesis protein TsaE [Aliiruegeria haliotis]|uniref:tRNA threonylcarbamoyladenosine biosynthesis protein TsaE n=1 Tax=Aliiruegeria haliotis TaxID=1280846 RepID=A0A2T0RHY6_9RHOB|nr:tRNA (adenosine(37)-N6)-threonylcarbamoyltransferase complex ATPase subunit type 1 TsaE [Aliiruegeria haliotis]PRY20710.1 tRNA threonylcarbamoyladenosine biosynthesis protein TsaE [Aliiruegeria haliotis]
MIHHAASPMQKQIHLLDADATATLGRDLAQLLVAGDTVLLSGSIGAGKSHLARAIIQERMALDRRPVEDVPSPTYTLVQTYSLTGVEIWHADLYRLTMPDEAFELGLDTAFEDAICLIEWPDRLGSDCPADALSIHLDVEATGRTATLSATDERWEPIVSEPASQPGASA